ncbi:50S ribosomal protein L10 [Leptolyngbya sp. 'hensonii']|uniref:50S ribosomal protein L10 n=1 Tax=Leptolyngbya sp. 'hensonii' TaxID=1922337 RepID=UPI00094FBBDC|nr:50S ribosomal protein L10 [Leptolyngbya sp. 'hensonii']OLP19440.1 50S ribosomal protein L10 [Leptolyngbya sp. 'hensonii']
MGRTLEDKKQIVAELKGHLDQAQMALIVDYKGLKVSEITDLRKRLRASGTVCTVTKNTLMQIAIDGNASWQPMSEFLSQSSAFLFVKEDIGGAIKAYQDFQKATKKTELRGGVMEGRALNPEDVKAIGDLPSKEQLMAQVAGAINSLTAKVAIGINEIPGSLARAIKAISEKEAA